MKKIVILKTGESLDSVKKDFGDFEDIIIKRGNIDKNEVVVVNCIKYEEPPRKEDIKGVIITGSNSMVSNHEEWSVKISDWLKSIVDTNIPVLGICYGHQLLADVLGGKVGYNPKGVEVGTVNINLTEEGKEDLLFKEMPDSFKCQVDHSQSILQLPEDVKVLANNDFEPTLSFSYKDHIWGFQFHPEFLPEITKEYVKYERDNLESRGIDFKEVLNTVEEAKEGDQLLKRFVSIVNKHI